MKKISLALTMALIGTASSAQAEDSLYLHAGGFSKHFESRAGNQDYNEVHNNFGLEYETSLSKGWAKLGRQWKGFYVSAIGQYMKNSLDNDTGIFGGALKHKWRYKRDWEFAIGGFAGTQNGYPNASEDRGKSSYVPVAYPFIEASYGRFGTYAACVPDIYNSGFCFVGFKARLHRW